MLDSIGLGTSSVSAQRPAATFPESGMRLRQRYRQPAPKNTVPSLIARMACTSIADFHGYGKACARRGTSIRIATVHAVRKPMNSSRQSRPK